MDLTWAKVLVGQEVEIVSFVRDYVELHFQSHWLRCLSGPIVENAEGEFAFPQACSRDAICGLIDQYVVEAEAPSPSLQDDEQLRRHPLRLRFDDGASLSVPLAYDLRVGPEAAHLVTLDEKGQSREMLIW